MKTSLQRRLLFDVGLIIGGGICVRLAWAFASTEGLNLSLADPMVLILFYAVYFGGWLAVGVGFVRGLAFLLRKR